MPFIKLTYNCKCGSDIEMALTGLLITRIESILGKERKWIMTDLTYSQNLRLAGTDEPAVMMELAVFGSVPIEKYENLSQALTHDISALLGVEERRVYIRYSETAIWAWNGYLF